MTRGCTPPLPVNAKRRNSLAAVRSRWGDNMKSIVSPVESTARYQVRPTTGDSHIRLVHPLGPIRMPTFAAKPLIQNGRIALHSSSDRDVIHREPALRHHLLQISIA